MRRPHRTILILILLISLYPWFLRAFYLGNISQLTHWLSWPALVLAFATPLYSLYLSIHLRSKPPLDDTERSQRNFVLLGVIVPPLFTFLGVILYMLGFGMNAELAMYYSFWAIAAITFLKSDTHVLSPSKQVPSWLRVAHGISSVFLLIFISVHLFNHLSANFGGEMHIQVMEKLRQYYRNPIVEVTLIAMFVFQLVSGLILLSKHSGNCSDGYRTTQLATGLLVMFFLVSHITAAIGLGRYFMSADTNWNWLVYAPGLLKDPWNVRLVVHYSLGVLALLLHLLLGLRVILIAHMGYKRANQLFWVVTPVPLFIVCFIMRPLLLA